MRRCALLVMVVIVISLSVATATLRYQRLLALPISTGLPVALTDGQATAKRAKLEQQLFSLRWVAYAPTNYNPQVSPPVIPSDESIQADLALLRQAGFDGLITYGASLTAIPRIAEQIGFRGMLLGVWQPGNTTEMAQAKVAAKRDLVMGIIVGNEGLTFSRYKLATLQQAMEEMKRETGKPVSTTEIIEAYFGKPELIEWSDFLAVNAHPFFHRVKEPRQAVAWTSKSYQNLLKRAQGKPLLFKEVGLPTAGEDGLSEEGQAQYYALLTATEVKFAWFEAFDGSWKSWGAVEPHWGLWRSDRRPKSVVRVIVSGDVFK